jgi:hypothetical protein
MPSSTPCVVERFESKHWAHAGFNEPVVLFDRAIVNEKKGLFPLLGWSASRSGPPPLLPSR